MGDLRGDSKFGRPLLVSERGEPVGFYCAEVPAEEVTTFGELAVGEEFILPGDPYQDVYRKLRADLARRGEEPILGWRPEELVVRI